MTVSVAAAAPAAPDAVSDDSSTPAAPVPNPAPTAASPSAEAADMSISEDGQPQMAVPVSNVAASSAPAESQDAWEADDDSNPAHLAMGQTIESNARPEASVDSTPSPSFATENEQPSNVAAGKPSKSIEDLLAESGAPVLDTQPGPGLIVSQHKSHHGPSIWASILIFLLTLALIALVADVLLDSEIWKPAFSIPHTHFIK